MKLEISDYDYNRVLGILNSIAHRDEDDIELHDNAEQVISILVDSEQSDVKDLITEALT